MASDLFQWGVLPFLIFLARMSDVTLATLRNIFLSKSVKCIVPFLGFVEVLIWLLAISQIMKNLHQLQLFDQELAYPALYQALDRIRVRYGDRAVLRAIGLEARSIGHYNPFDGEPPILLANRSV